jgi:AcrR family transcriptional regulator
MSPRGVAIPDVRERLFAAAERVLAREGPSALTNRAITSEADCAKGLLYNHFADLDDFIAELVIDRFRLTTQATASLASRAGERTVAENLIEAAMTLLGSNGPAIAGLAMSRPAVSVRVRTALEKGAPSFATLEKTLAAYLEAEKKLGRVVPDRDTASLALAIVGSVHHLLMTGWAGAPDPAGRIRRLIAELTDTPAR